MKTITLRISDECLEAYNFLQSKKINPAKYLRNGGEPLVIAMAKKNKFTLKKLNMHYF